MGNSRNTGYLQNVVKVSDTGNIAFMSGSTMLMSLDNTGQMSGSVPVLAAATASFVAVAQTASFVALAQSASNAVSAVTASFANTFTVGSTLTAQTLVVQTITSSVDFVTGSTRFGSILGNTHTFTGSLLVSGSSVNINNKISIQSPSSSYGQIQITNNVSGGEASIGFIGGIGVVGNNPTSSTDGDAAIFAIGSNIFSSGTTKFGIGNKAYAGAILIVSSSGNIGIGTTNPRAVLDISAGEGTPVVRLIRTTFAGYGSQLHFSTTGSNRFVIGLNPNDDLYFDRDTTGNGGWNPTTLVIQRSTGNIGIGTSSPGYSLHINNNSNNIALLINQPSSTNTAYNSIYWTGNHTPVLGYIGTGASATANGALQNAFYMGIANSYPLVFLTSDTERLRIDSTGNITWINSNTPLNLRPENTPSTAITSLSSASSTYNQKPGVYWLNYGGQVFLGYVKFNWHQGRNWVLALKCHNIHDMPAGSALWQNNTLINQSDFNLQSGRMAKYAAWNYFPFTRLLYEMGNRIPPIMQWNSQKTSLYSVFSSITVSNGSGVGCDSTSPQISTTESTTYYGMANFLGSNFDSAYGGAEVNINFYGLGSFANNSNNSTSAANTGVTSGFGLTTEHLGAFSSLQSTGRSGAWIGCPLDEGGHVFNAASSPGADSGFGLGVAGGNNARTTTSGIISWALGNNVANFLPAYVWLSID